MDGSSENSQEHGNRPQSEQENVPQIQGTNGGRPDLINGNINKQDTPSSGGGVNPPITGISGDGSGGPNQQTSVGGNEDTAAGGNGVTATDVC